MIKIDAYTGLARVIPAFIIALPLALIGYTWMPDSFAVLEGGLGKALSKGALASGLFAAVAFVVSQATRDAGKRLETRLWPEWDGSPSVRFLRHRDAAIDAVTKCRFHKRLVELGAVPSMPTLNDENLDPTGSDAFYRSASDWLRAKTRDEKKFNLIFKENVNYGFQRNLLGCKPIGLAICAVSAGSIGFAIYLGKLPLLESGVTVIVALFLLTSVNESSLRRISDDYAKRLLEAIDQIEPAKTIAARSNAPKLAAKKTAPAEV